MNIQSAKVIIDMNTIKIRIGDGSVVYTTDINSFEAESGLTIHNVDLDSELKAYFIKFGDMSDTFVCGNVIDNLGLVLENDYKNSLIIMDFDGVDEVSESFFKSYTKFLLQTTNKIITINMNTSITNEFGAFIRNRIKDIEEEEEEE